MFIKKYMLPYKTLMVALGVSLMMSGPARALDIPFFGGDGEEEEIWRATEQYVMLKPQDIDEAEPNDHPADLAAEDITTALISLEYWKDGWFKSNKEEEGNDVFTDSTARTLGARLAEGLRKAKPEQDVVFALAQLKAVMLGMKDRAYVSGRAFYRDGKLNIILGDYDRPPDKGKELAGKAHGVNVDETTYFFDEGSRRRSGDFGHSVMTGNGIEVHQDDQGIRRNDWFVIDVERVAAAARERRRQAEKGPESEETRQMRLEAARMQKEQRELRAEMARMRKEMRESGSSGGGGESVEERMATLEKLYKQELISREEYEAKRQEILKDI